jgi:hypothetical protein
MTPQEFREFKHLTYLQFASLLHCSKTRAFDICNKQGGSLKLKEINLLLKIGKGNILPADLGLEVA